MTAIGRTGEEGNVYKSGSSSNPNAPDSTGLTGNDDTNAVVTGFVLTLENRLVCDLLAVIRLTPFVSLCLSNDSLSLFSGLGTMVEKRSFHSEVHQHMSDESLYVQW